MELEVELEMFQKCPWQLSFGSFKGPEIREILEVKIELGKEAEASVAAATNDKAAYSIFTTTKNGFNQKLSMASSSMLKSIFLISHSNGGSTYSSFIGFR